MEEAKRHTSAEYERELQEIRDGLLYMGALTEKALEKGTAALVERDSELAKQVICEDDQIDRLDFELEEKCIRLLASASPPPGTCGSSRHRSRSPATWSGSATWRPISPRRSLS